MFGSGLHQTRGSSHGSTRSWNRGSGATRTQTKGSIPIISLFILLGKCHSPSPGNQPILASRFVQCCHLHFFPIAYIIMIMTRLALKADRPHPRNYPHMWPDYRHTDKHFRLIMTLIALCRTWQSRAPNRNMTLTFDLDPRGWPRPLTLTLTFEKQGNMSKHDILQFDLDLWPTTMTYNPTLAWVKVDPHAKN